MIPKTAVDIDKVIGLLKTIYTSKEEHTFIDSIVKICWKEALDIKIKYDYKDIVECLLFHMYRDNAIKAPNTIRVPNSKIQISMDCDFRFYDADNDMLEELRTVLSVDKNEDLLPYTNSEYEVVINIVKKRFEINI